MFRLCDLRRLIVIGVTCAAVLIGPLLPTGRGQVLAADKAKIQASVSKAQAYLLRKQLGGSFGAIAALALVKSGISKKTPAIEGVVREITNKVKDDVYTVGLLHNYEASVDLMVLEAIDPVAYVPQMTAIVKHLVEVQRENGSWYYPTLDGPDSGDTSITQYVILGLWAAARAGVDVPVEVWEKAAKWLMDNQSEDGGFAYHPFARKTSPASDWARNTNTMTAAGTGSLLIIRRVLFGESDAKVRPPDAKRRFGVLEKFTEDTQKKALVSSAVSLKTAPLEKAIKDGTRWIGVHYTEKSKFHEEWLMYLMYSNERVAALLDVTKFGSHDWYEEGSDELVLRQLPDGSWKDGSSEIPATAMALMFLTKATATIVSPQKKVNMLGGGIQIGGRGLPDNLDSVQVKDGEVGQRKIVGAVDNLLIELERSSDDAKVENAQAAIVEAVQVDRPEELIGQMARLKKLATDNRPEVRRTALWALGRSGDFSASPLLIQGLMDPDPAIAREASVGLSLLSRLPEGCGQPVDPTDDIAMGLKEDATEEQREKAFGAWQAESKRRWTEWYQKYRNYNERDDRTTLKKAAK